MTRLVLEGLVKRYDRVSVVDLDMDRPLEVEPGELLVGLGPSGAGKTVLARLVAGLERADEGEIYLDEKPVSLLPAEERRVGLVFQDDALWPHLTVEENLAFGLRARGISRKERRSRLDEALSAARLDGLAGRKPGSLSPLQRRRAALARAMVAEPAVLVLDEPFEGLEHRARDEFRDEIRALVSEQKTTTLLLTRDVKTALAMAERLAVLDLGRVVQVGPAGEIYNRPVSSFVAKLMGPVNLLPGQAESMDVRGQAVVRTPLGRLVGRLGPVPVASGSACTVAIRPEALALGPAIPPDANRFAATLERQAFEGALRLVHLRGPGDWPVLSVSLQHIHPDLREGQGLTVSVLPHLVAVLPSTYAAGT